MEYVGVYSYGEASKEQVLEDKRESLSRVFVQLLP